MVMKMNKNNFINKLMEITNYSEENCILINNIMENHFIIGRNNKIKIMNDFIEKLDISKEEADELYNICMKIIIKGIFK